MRSLFNGCAVALITPFKCGKVDNFAFKNLIERNILQGAKAIVVLATTGEGSTITEPERENIIKLAKKTIGGRAKLIVGTGNNNLQVALKNTVTAKKLGADGALVVTPYYNKTTQAGLLDYYTEITKVGLPIIVYNVPSRTGLNIQIDTIKKLISNKMIYGIKESTSDIDRIISLSHVCKNKIALYSGEDRLNYIFYALGGDGCISVTANAYCNKVQKIYDLVKLNMFEDALFLQNKLDEINKLLFVETNPIPIKYLLAKMNLCENELRKPLVCLSTKAQKLIDKAKKELS